MALAYVLFILVFCFFVFGVSFELRVLGANRTCAFVSITASVFVLLTS